MGKSLIIKGADFSSNGFKYTKVIKTVTDLYNYQNVKIEDWSVQMATPSNGVYYSEKANAVLGKGTALNGTASTLLIDVEDYTHAKVYTKCNIPYSPSAPSVLGVAIMLFVDSNNKIIGGYSTANVNSSNTISEGVGAINTMTYFEKEIPTGCRYVVCTFNGTNASTLFESFKLELKKYVSA